MSWGVPVVSTPNSCAPDPLHYGVEGSVLPIRSPSSIAEKSSWGLDHHTELAAMGMAASAKAATMTRARFREGYRAMVDSVDTAASPSGHARGAAGLVRQVPGAASGPRVGG
jgi:hypothetical protein